MDFKILEFCLSTQIAKQGLVNEDGQSKGFYLYKRH